MSRAVTWGVRDDDFGMREAAADAARRVGLSLHEWLDDTFRTYSAELGVRPESLDDDERAHAVVQRLGRDFRAEERTPARSDKRRAAPYGEGFWSRTAQAMSDLDAERFGGRALRQRETAETSLRRRDGGDPAWRDEMLRRRSTSGARPADPYDDVSEGPPAHEPPARAAKATRRTAGSEQTVLKRELSKFATILAEVHETMTARGASSAEIEALRDEVADITRGLATLAPREAIAQLDHAIQDLGHRLAGVRGEGLVDQFVAPVQALVDDLKRTMVAIAPGAALETLDTRIGMLAEHVATLADARVDPEMLTAVLEQTAEIRRVLEDSAQNNRHLADIERNIADLGERLDRIADRGQTSAGLEAVYRAIEHIRAEIHRNDPAQMLAALDERVEELLNRFIGVDMTQRFERLDDRLDAMHRDLAERAPELGRLESILSAVEARLDSRVVAEVDTSHLEAIIADLGDRLEYRADPDELRSLVQDLSRKLEDSLANSADGSVIEALEAQIEKLSAHMNAPSRGDVNTARLERMIEALAERIEGPISRRAADQVQDTIRLLVERFERAVRDGAPANAFAALEDRLNDVSARLDANVSSYDPARLEDMLSAINARLDNTHNDADAQMVVRSLQQMNEQIEQLREAAYDSAEIAARKAAQEAVAMQASGEGNRSESLLERDIADLREMQQAADLRTHSTLAAVHETLEMVVSRLATFESQGAKSPPPRPPADERPAAPAPERAREVADTSGYKPSVELSFGPSPGAEPSFGIDEAPRQAPPVSARREPGAAAQRISTSSDSDFLLEPGIGKPTARQSAAARQVIGDAGQSAQASFIAAVRRAQQTGSAGRDPMLGAGGFEDDSDLERPLADDTDSKSARSIFSGVKGKLLIGVSAVLLIFAAWHVVRPLIPGPGSSAPAPKQVSQAPPAARTTPSKSEMRAADPLAGPAAQDAPEPARTANAAAAPLAPATPPRDLTALARLPETPQPPDMAPVSSLAPARSSGPVPAPRDPLALAAAGSASAQFELGSRFADGRHGPKDLAKAVEWLSKAASQNFPPAQYRLGALYEKGVGVARNPERARALYQSAAEGGNVKAMHNLGSFLAEGIGGRPDYAAAARWFRQAAEHGVRDSQYNLGVLSARGLGVQQDLVQSYVWFAAAAAQGDEDSAAKLKEVISRLDPRQLAQAKAIHQSFRPKPADRGGNDPQTPEGGWATQASARNAPTASRPARVSSM